MNSMHEVPGPKIQQGLNLIAMMCTQHATSKFDKRLGYKQKSVAEVSHKHIYR
jgi:hypothetical protein